MTGIVDSGSVNSNSSIPTPYEDLIRDVLKNGSFKEDRTGTGTYSVFGRQLEYDLSQGFPLVTTKKVNYNSVIGELIWFLRGDTQVDYLHENKIKIWDEWADEYGFLGSIYGSQWRNWYNVSDTYIEVPRYKLIDTENIEPTVGVDDSEGMNFSPKIKNMWDRLVAANRILDEWLVFSNFYKGIRLAPGFAQWYRNDKEFLLASSYYGTNVVNKDTAIFVPKWYYKEIQESFYIDYAQPILKRRKVYYDQIEEIVDTIENNPHSRRIILNAWNVAEIDNMALPPCHTMFQFYVDNGKLSGQLYQRSADLFLGVPFNIASYSLLIHMVARKTGLEVGKFVWTGGDCHIYSNHIEQVKTQLSREPKPYPTISFTNSPDTELEDYEISDVVINNYDPHPFIKGAVSV